MYEETVRLIGEAGVQAVQLPPDTDLPVFLMNHADLSVFTVGPTVVFRRGYYERCAIRELLSNSGITERTVLAEGAAGRTYPLDAGFCARVAGKFLICCEKITDGQVLSAAAENGLSVIDVKQGYSACSAAVLSDGSVMTADEGIRRALERRGVCVLRLKPGGIRLDGYGSGNDGFIGGCCGLYGNRLFFNGNPLSHPDGRFVLEFCAEHGTEAVYPENLPLNDIGGLIFSQ